MEKEKKPLHEYYVKAIFEENDLDEKESSDTNRLILMSKYCIPEMVMTEDYNTIYRVPFESIKDKFYSEEEAFTLRLNGWKLSEDKNYIFFKP